MKNGLYSIHVSLLDGRSGKGSGVILFRDGQILGGDAYLFYTGSYSVKGDTFKGEVLVQRHTSSPDANPLFGGPTPVGIGVSGTFTDTTARDERDGAGRKGQPDFRGDAAQAGGQQLEVTSPRLRGEVKAGAQRRLRVRGLSTHSDSRIVPLTRLASSMRDDLSPPAGRGEETPTPPPARSAPPAAG